MSNFWGAVQHFDTTSLVNRKLTFCNALIVNGEKSVMKAWVVSKVRCETNELK